MGNKEFAEEQAYLEKVEQYIDRRISVLEEKKEELRHEISAGRKNMWEEGRHGVNDFDDVVDIYLRSEGIVAGERQYEENIKELERLQRMKSNPYFAAIDVAEDGYAQEERFYVGAVGLKDDKSYDMYICDWRAPISALYYGFDVGKAWYEVDGRRIDVDMTRKRQIQIAEGKLINIYDTDSSMHDAILGNILSENTTNKLRVIVSSIQKEQNTAIRKIDKRTVLIYGPAGSGKTSVGLHRLAYILYQQRDKIRAENIVILSNNNIYHSYVSGILPALCEDEVSHTIFQDLLRKLLPKGMRAENYYAQYNALQQSDAQERKQVLAYQYSAELLRFLEEYFTQYRFEFEDLVYRGHVITTATELDNKIKRNKYLSYENSLQNVTDTIKKIYEDYFTENKDGICEDLEARVKEYISAQELEVLFIKAKKRAVQEALEAFEEKNKLDAKVHAVCVLQRFMMKQGLQEVFVGRVCERLSRELQNGCLRHENALLYVLVRIYMGEVSILGSTLHVLVDEAQDYSLLQLAVLKKLYPQSSFTLLADVCQAISPETTIGSYDEFEAVFGSELERLPLLKSYRSSGRINSLAFHLMEKFQREYAGNYSYFMREGNKPCYIVSKNMKESILRRLKELKHYNMVGILTKDEAAANRIYQWLQFFEETVQLINKPNDEMKARIVIIPLVLSKGLEFDAVLVCDFQGNDTDENNSKPRCETAVMAAKMYLACTRALHELYFVEEGDLPADLQDCYEFMQIIKE